MSVSMQEFISLGALPCDYWVCLSVCLWVGSPRNWRRIPQGFAATAITTHPDPIIGGSRTRAREEGVVGPPTSPQRACLNRASDVTKESSIAPVAHGCRG
jgi:hypothetical protein